MGDMLRAHGAHNYHISLMPSTNLLFAYVEVEDLARWAEVADTPVCKEWWAWMEEFIVFKDGKPVSTPLKQMFFLE